MKMHVLVSAGMLFVATSIPVVAAPLSADVQLAQAAPVAGKPMTDGEVRKIDKDQGKLTLRHGPIANLEMPAMSMVFKVADPKMLEGIQEGDKVRFVAERVGGAITVTAVEPVEPVK